VFDIESLEYFKKLREKIIKILSGEITNFPLIQEIGKMNIKLIMSTGMSNYNEINEAIKLLTKNGTKKKNIYLLHCNTAYPTPPCDANLPKLKILKKKFGVKVGYSDHTLGIEIPIAAVCFGAKIIEKHLTIDKKLSGPDHKNSLMPKEFITMVKSIRNTEKASTALKRSISFSEKSNVKVVRKSIVARKKILKGEIFTELNLTTKRPGSGKNQMKWEKIIGKKNKRIFKR